jgi:hypothetical protein
VFENIVLKGGDETKVRAYGKGCNSKCRIVVLSTKLASRKTLRVKVLDRHRSKHEH